MEVRFENGEEDTVRLIGVDTPETTLGNVAPDEYEDIPDTQPARNHLYRWGQEASQYAADGGECLVNWSFLVQHSDLDEGAVVQGGSYAITSASSWSVRSQ